MDGYWIRTPLSLTWESVSGPPAWMSEIKRPKTRVRWARKPGRLVVLARTYR